MQSNIQIVEPYVNCVYQRNSDGSAVVPIVGTVDSSISSVTATFTPLNGGAQTVQQIEVVSGKFSAGVLVAGGWYSLTLMAGTDIAQVLRVGAGEVFVLFGHSFLAGGHDLSHQLPSTDERVITLLDNMNAVEYKYGQLRDQVGPFGLYPDAWGMLGDLLVKRLGVPVLLYGSAYGGSNLNMNLQVINGQALTQLPPGYPGQASRMPYAPLERTFDSYVKKTGIRGVLFEHGYNDRGTDRVTFANRLREFFNYVRSHWNKPELAFVMVQEQLQASGIVGFDAPTAQGQQDVIGIYANTFAGPNFNNHEWDSMFLQHDHLYGNAIDLFAKEWNDSISETFLLKAVPYVSETVNVIYPDGLISYAPTVSAIDWMIMAGAALCLIGIFVYKSKYLIWGFLVLALLAMARMNGKL